MDNLVTANQQDWQIDCSLAFFKDLNPPAYRNPGVNQGVHDGQNQTTKPAEHKPKENTVDGGVQPGRRVGEAKFIDCHPFVLEQPIPYEVKQQRGFKR